MWDFSMTYLRAAGLLKSVHFLMTRMTLKLYLMAHFLVGSTNGILCFFVVIHVRIKIPQRQQRGEGTKCTRLDNLASSKKIKIILVMESKFYYMQYHEQKTIGAQYHVPQKYTFI